LIQIHKLKNVNISKRVISTNHVRIRVEYRPSLSISDLVKNLKGRSLRKLQQEFPELSKRYWGHHFLSINYGCWSIGNIADGKVNEYLEHYQKPKDDGSSFILE